MRQRQPYRSALEADRGAGRVALDRPALVQQLDGGHVGSQHEHAAILADRRIEQLARSIAMFDVGDDNIVL